VLYPQNGDRIVTTDSVTSLHPTYSILHVVGHTMSSAIDQQRAAVKYTAASPSANRLLDRLPSGNESSHDLKMYAEAAHFDPADAWQRIATGFADHRH